MSGLLTATLGPTISSTLRGIADKGAGGFSPASLFAAGAQGAWYDPSDFSSMFQYSTGTTPVTAVGQPVGLMRDKHILPTTKTMPVMTCSGTVMQSGSLLTFNSSPSGDNASGNLPVNAAGFYRMTFTVAGTGSVTIYVGASPQVFAAGTYAGTWYAAGATTFLFRANAGGFNGTVSVANITEYLGNHASQATAGKRPLYQAAPSRIIYDGVDDVLNTTFAASLGSACTVARSVPGTGASILTAQTIGTSYADSTNHCGLIIINRALTVPETANVTAYLNKQAGL